MITSPELENLDNIRHGFFTRQGGVSDGIFSSLNCGYGSDDYKDKVAENRRRVSAALGGGDLCTIYQCHSSRAAYVDDVWERENAPEADAMVTDRKGIILGILTADCAPVLFADKNAGVIGAAHAGWKGAIGGIIENTVSLMEDTGAKKENIIAVVGPCIGSKSYEVGSEFHENFINHDSANDKFFANGYKPGKFFFNLPGYVTHKLELAGVGEVSYTGNDTLKEEDSFFSYRRNTIQGEKQYGRQMSAICLG